jgi:hypothetical protein
MTYDPTVMSDIGNCAFISYQIARCGGFQMVIKHLIQAASFSLIAVYAILDMLGCVSSKMIRLTLHRPNSSVEEEELERDLGQPLVIVREYKSILYPTIRLIVLSCSWWIGDLVLGIVLSNQVLLNAPRFKQTD